MDEPTAALDDTDAARLLTSCGGLRQEGVAVVYVSHRLPEIAAIADRVSVLKDGRQVLTDTTDAMPPERLVRAMVGRDLADFFPARAAPAGRGGARDRGMAAMPCWRASTSRSGAARSWASRDWRAPARPRSRTRHLRRPALRARRDAAATAAPSRAALGRATASRAGIGFLPDDRKREGLALGQSLRDNAALTLRAFARALAPPRARRHGQRRRWTRGCGRSTCAPRASTSPVRAALRRQPAEGHRRPLAGARPDSCSSSPSRRAASTSPPRPRSTPSCATSPTRGRGILMISSDLPEVIGVSDRIVVMHEGRIAGELPRRRAGGGGDGPRRSAHWRRARSSPDRRLSDRSRSLARAAARRARRSRCCCSSGRRALRRGRPSGRARSTSSARTGCRPAAAHGRARHRWRSARPSSILGGSIDLSVGSLISVSGGARLLPHARATRPDAARPCWSCSLVSAAIGAVNGLVIARLSVSPLIATLGSGLILQGVLSANFNNFAGSVPRDFQAVAYGASRPAALVGARPLHARARRPPGCCAARASARISMRSAATRPARRLAGIRDRARAGRRRMCSAACSPASPGLYLASRLRSGAPWIGRDGVYDLESIAVVVIGGTLLAGGRGGVWGTIAGVLLFAVHRRRRSTCWACRPSPSRCCAAPS